MRSLPCILALLVTLLSITACREEHKERMQDIQDEENTPTMTTLNVETFISDSGYTRYRITTDEWNIYDKSTTPRWTFPKGVYLQRYDDNFVPNGEFQCDSATYLSQSKLWQFDGNVRMRNNVGDKFLTEQLFWDQTSHTMYTDSFIHIERSDRILEGMGFNSNEHLTNYTILQPQGIFPVNRPERDSTSVDSLRAVRRVAPAPTDNPIQQPLTPATN